MLVLEVRGAEGRGSINQKGNYQSTVMGLEVHVKDEARFPGKWAFFGFDDGKTAKMTPTTAELLQLPRRAWSRGHHVRAVLSNPATPCEEQSRRSLPRTSKSLPTQK